MKLIKIDQFNSCVVDSAGRIIYPYSSFLNQKSNLGTRSVEFKAIKILDIYLNAKNIDLAVSSVKTKKFFSLEQVRELKRLCWIPLPEIENTSPSFLTGSKKQFKRESASSENLGGISRNTVAQRTETIIRFLQHYEMYFIPQLISNFEDRIKIKENLELVKSQLSNIRRSDTNHYGKIISLPTSKFIEVIETIINVPNKIFLNKSGNISRNVLRDQCIFLMACEGLRPGAICSINIGQNYNPATGLLDLNNISEISSKTYLPKSKGFNSQARVYSQPVLKVYSFTKLLINQYIETERAKILKKSGKNISHGRLFITERGTPISSTTTLKNIFTQAGKALTEMGILDINQDPHMSYESNKDKYKFYAYVLRHSAASFFLAASGISDPTLESMKIRFGWSKNSIQPERYAKREYIDISNATLHTHMQELIDIAAQKKQPHDY